MLVDWSIANIMSAALGHVMFGVTTTKYSFIRSFVFNSGSNCKVRKTTDKSSEINEIVKILPMLPSSPYKLCNCYTLTAQYPTSSAITGKFINLVR